MFEIQILKYEPLTSYLCFILKYFSYRIIIILCIFLCREPLLSQNLSNVQVISSSDGLSNRNINCILQDNKGYMWFGTENGLNRYDGKDFLVFSVNSPNGHIADNKIKSMAKDQTGNIWMVTNKGINIIDPDNFKITYLPQIVKSNTGGIDRIEFVYCIKTQIFATTNTGYLYRYSGNKKWQEIFSLAPHIISAQLTGFPAMTIDSNNYLWIANRYHGIFKLDRNFKFVKHYPVDGSILGLNIFNRDRFLVWALGSFYKYDEKKDSFVRAFSNEFPGRIRACFQDSNNSLWVVSNKKLIRYNHDGQKDYSYLISYIAKDAWPQCMCVDMNFNLWMGTEFGILRIPSRKTIFRTLLADPKSDEMRKSMRSLFQADDGSIYAGAYDNGLFKINEANNSVKKVKVPEVIFGKDAKLMAYAMVSDNKYLWIASVGDGLLKYDTVTKEFTTYSYYMNKPFSHENTCFLTSLAKNKLTGELWIGSYQTLSFKSFSKDSFYNYSKVYPNTPLEYCAVNAIVFSGDGKKTYLGTSVGLFQLDANSKKIKKSYFSAGNGKEILNILCVKEDNEGNIWLGTKGHGLYCLYSNGKIRNWSRINGLSDNIVTAIVISHGDLWISTNDGISYFDPGSNEFRHYYIENGLADNEFNHGASLLTKSGKIYFGGINGITYFDPLVIKKTDAVIAKLHITRLSYYDEKTRKTIDKFTKLDSIKTIILSAENKALNIYFALTDYTHPDKNQFEYKIEGFDSVWNYIGNQNSIRIMGIPSGKYLLRIRANEGDGFRKGDEIRIAILAEDFFYKSWWFISICILALACAGIAFYFYKLRHLKKILLLRTSIASDLHDEVGSYLTRIALQSDLLQEEKDEKYKNELLQKISGVSRIALSSMSDVIWSIDSQNDNVTNVLDRMNEHAQVMFEPRNISCIFDTPAIDKSFHLSLSVRQNIYLIYKEAINNIVKHSNATEVKVSISQHKGYFEMRIKDNGIGEKKEFISGGNGLRNMNKRAARIKGQLLINRENGFEVILTIPT